MMHCMLLSLWDDAPCGGPKALPKPCSTCRCCSVTGALSGYGTLHPVAPGQGTSAAPACGAPAGMSPKPYTTVPVFQDMHKVEAPLLLHGPRVYKSNPRTITPNPDRSICFGIIPHVVVLDPSRSESQFESSVVVQCGTVSIILVGVSEQDTCCKR